MWNIYIWVFRVKQPFKPPATANFFNLEQVEGGSASAALLAYFIRLWQLMAYDIFNPPLLLCRHVRHSSSRSETQTSRPCQAPKCGGSFPLQPIPAPGAGHRRRLGSTSKWHPSPHWESRPSPRRHSWVGSQCGPQRKPWWGSRRGTHWSSWELQQLWWWIHSAGVHWYWHHHWADEEKDHEDWLWL